MRAFRPLPCAVLAAAMSLPAAAQLPAAAPVARDGQEVFAQVCAVCHASGRDGAPRVGDSKAWAARAARGLTGLTQTAVVGVRRMPPHGGKLDVTDVEIRRAIAYMVNHSGGRWAEPIDRAAPPKPSPGADVAKAKCLECHGGGRDGAPRLGDRDAWIGRAKEGFDTLVQSAIRGHGGMPARGGMAGLTDAEMRSAVTYLFQASVREPQR